MQRKPVLGDLEDVFQRQLLRLRWDVLLSQRCDTSRERERKISFAVINLQNAWTNFVRAFYLSCVFGARTKSAVRVRPSSVFPDANAAIGFAIRLFRPHASPNTFGQWHRRDEPVWHDPATLLRLSTNLGLQNDGKIQAAFSLNLYVFSDLPVVRNFFAHRNQSTEQAAQMASQHYGIISSLRPSRMLAANPLRRPQCLMLEWLDELRITADFLCD